MMHRLPPSRRGRSAWLPVSPWIALSGLGVIAALVCSSAALVLYLALAGGSDLARPVTVTPGVEPSTSGPATALPQPADAITFDASGQYAFPVAADPGLYRWTQFHWDGTHAVDIEARFELDRAAFTHATAAPLAAVASGILLNYSGSTGGTGYMLQADDGVDYYYAHLSEQWLPDGTRVTAGQIIGRMGNTGRGAQYIEPHLHMSIGPRDTLWTQPASINAAGWLYDRFGLPWDDTPLPDVPAAQPQGWPVSHPQIAVVTPFDQAAARGLPQPAIEIGFSGAPPAGPLDVVAPLDGVLNVVRWTTVYGTRLQIDNRAAQITISISGVDEWLVEDGQAVNRGQVIGRWWPSHRPTLNYLMYRNGVLVDPAPSLAQVCPGCV